MLIGASRAAVPSVIGDVDEKVRSLAPVVTRQVGEDRLVTNQDPQPADGGRVEWQPASVAEPAEPLQVEPAGWDERHALDDRDEIVLAVDRIGGPVTGGVVEEGGVVGIVRLVGIYHDVETAGDERRTGRAHALRDRGVPVRPIDEVVRHRGLGPDQQIEARAVPELARQREQILHDAVAARLVPLLTEPLIGLDQPHDSDRAHRQRALTPRPVTPREGDRAEHSDERPPPNRTAPRCLLAPYQERVDQHHVAPRDPQRHAPRACEVRPLHEDRRVGERGAEPEPGKPDVTLVADRPVHGGPDDREQHP